MPGSPVCLVGSIESRMCGLINGTTIMIYFTADTHFGHKAICRLADRPFTSVAHMDDELIRRWNDVITPGDIVYHLGDFALSPLERALEILDALNGTIHLIEGNHDSLIKRSAFRDRFASIECLSEIKVALPDADEPQRIVLCHYAMRVWKKSHRGAWHLYGHSHGSLPDDPHALSLDVGVDTPGADYSPISLTTITERMKRKEWRPIDHHGDVQ